MDELAVRLQNVTRRFGTFEAVKNVSLDIHDGEFFSLLGPSGCGKTTSLRMIAGFDVPTEGVIEIFGQPQGETPPYKRPVNTVFQNYALFPHMTVWDNVAFGLQMRRIPRADISKRVQDALDMVRMGNLGERKPTQLSGGQQQRVALARALVNEPDVLLLDEPLGALDLKLRKEMQLELKALQLRVETCFIYVTHDQEEALNMSDRIAVMQGGEVIQVGTPREIYETPWTRFVADFIGETNFMDAVYIEDGGRQAVKIDDTLVVSALPDDDDGIVNGQAVTLSIRPEKLTLLPASANGTALSTVPRSPGNTPAHEDVLVPARVLSADYLGTDTRYTVAVTERSKVVVRSQNDGMRYDTPFRVGDPVLVHWQVGNARVLPE